MSKTFQNPEEHALEDDLNIEEEEMNSTFNRNHKFSPFLHLCEQKQVKISE